MLLFVPFLYLSLFPGIPGYWLSQKSPLGSSMPPLILPGDMPERRHNIQAITGISSPSSPVKSLVGLGAKRENACRALVERAVNLAESCAVCSNASMANIEILTAVKETIIGACIPSFRSHFFLLTRFAPSGVPHPPLFHPTLVDSAASPTRARSSRKVLYLRRR